MNKAIKSIDLKDSINNNIFKISLLFLTILLMIFNIVITNASDCDQILDEEAKKECLKYQEEKEKLEDKVKTVSSKLQDIRNEKNQVNQTINSLKGEINITSEQINQVQQQIDQINKELDFINENLKDRKSTIQQKTEFRNKIIRNYSKEYKAKDIELFSTIFSFSNSNQNSNNINNSESNIGFGSQSLQFGIAKYVTNHLMTLIHVLSQEIDSFEKDKQEGIDLKNEMVTSQNNLLSLKNQLDNQKNQANNELNVLGDKEEDYNEDLSELEKEIKELSQKQQAILQAKGGEFSASLSEGVETDDARTSASYNPGFSPAFGVFSYGAYTHRNGMSQYGAKGRAEDGQDYKEILKFYYKSGVTEVDGLDDRQIKVDGFGTYSMQKYLYGLGEMPSSWPMDALKSQAIAARTYAYRYLKKSSSICANTNCQYFHSDLINGSSRDRWRQAVDETENMVLKEDVTAQYSSTTGGWLNGIGWDTDGGSWPNDAYEKKAGSPWFYKAWFTQTYNKNSSTCGRSSPWLNSEEMADILNAYVLLKEEKNTERVVPETINDCPINGVSGKPYSKSELREKAKSADGDTGFKKVTKLIDVKFDTSKGKTTSIKFQTDNGEYTVSDAQLFSEAFNIRAPGYIAIKHTPDSKALFDILQK